MLTSATEIHHSENAGATKYRKGVRITSGLYCLIFCMEEIHKPEPFTGVRYETSTSFLFIPLFPDS